VLEVGKASGIDNTEFEHLRYAHPRSFVFTSILFNCIPLINGQHLDNCVADSYRGITLSPHITRTGIEIQVSKFVYSIYCFNIALCSCSYATNHFPCNMRSIHVCNVMYSNLWCGKITKRDQRSSTKALHFDFSLLGNAIKSR